MRVLIIEHIEDDYALFKSFLSTAKLKQFADVRCVSLSDAKIIAGSSNFDLIFADIALPDSDGISTFTTLSEIAPSAPIIFLCTPEQENAALELLDTGAKDYLVKSVMNTVCLERSIRYSLEMKASDKKLAECRAKLNTLTENTDNMIVSVDTNKRLIAANSIFSQFFKKNTGYDITPGENIIEYLPEKTAKFYNKIFSRALNGDSFSEEYQIDLSNGESIYLDFSVYPIFSKYELIGFNCFIQNITDRKETEKKIDKYLKELKALNNTKDKFFSIISHDLRNPVLNSLNSLSIILNTYEEMSDSEIIDNIGSVYKSFQNVYNLLEELLLWARSQVGNIEYHPEKFDMNFMVQTVFNTLSHSATAKKIILSNNIRENEIVYADPSMISTVLRNLISNAIKFSFSGGTVEVSANCQDDYFAVINIKDTGIGISTDIKSKLFRIDEQVTSPGTNEETGTGLGLVLCREFVERNKGKIWVESVLGEGSEFKFTLPRGEI